MNWLRDIAYGIGLGVTFPVWGWRLLRTGKWRTDWKERFGHVPSPPPEVGHGLTGDKWDEAGNGEKGAEVGETNRPSKPTVLIHAVSVGEVNATRQLVEQLTSDDAKPCNVVISATTNTGVARARALFEPAHRVVRFPFDFSRSVKRFLDDVQPDVVVLVELEVWPTFMNVCAARRIPVAVINGRLSQRSFKRYRLIRPLIRGAFAKLSAAAVQTPMYAAHFEQMGCPPDRIDVTDTMKWDTAKIEEPADVQGANELAAEMGIDRERPLVVAGSTGPGEEALLLKDKPADVQLLIAPRKPERFDEVAKLVTEQTGKKVVRRSQQPNALNVSKGNNQEPRSPGNVPHGEAEQPDIFLLDTIGELRQAYALAHAVIVGRSFIDLYGSDPIEPIALGKPTVIGPQHSDFQDTVDAFAADDGIVITDEPWPAIRAILDDPARAKTLGEAGRQTIRTRQGATEKHMALIRSLLRKQE